jgi:transcription antitermination factor NusG
MEGYVFVASGLTDTLYFALERKPYVSKVMSAPAGPHRIRTLSVIPNTRIEELRQQLRKMASSDIGEGDTVQVINGTYRGMEGEVLLVQGETALVRFRLRSLDQIATIPLAFLEGVSVPSGHGTP